MRTPSLSLGSESRNGSWHRARLDSRRDASFPIAICLLAAWFRCMVSSVYPPSMVLDMHDFLVLGVRGVHRTQNGRDCFYFAHHSTWQRDNALLLVSRHFVFWAFIYQGQHLETLELTTWSFSVYEDSDLVASCFDLCSHIEVGEPSAPRLAILIRNTS